MCIRDRPRSFAPRPRLPHPLPAPHPGGLGAQSRCAGDPMSLLNFGQPANGIMQMAYIVKDIHKAMDEWVSRLNVGPWFLLDHFTGLHPVYRGPPSRAPVPTRRSVAAPKAFLVMPRQPQSAPQVLVPRFDHAADARRADFSVHQEGV